MHERELIGTIIEVYKKWKPHSPENKQNLETDALLQGHIRDVISKGQA